MTTVWVVVIVTLTGGQPIMTYMPTAGVYATKGLCEFEGLTSLANRENASCVPFAVRLSK